MRLVTRLLCKIVFLSESLSNVNLMYKDTILYHKIIDQYSLLRYAGRVIKKEPAAWAEKLSQAAGP